MEGPFGVNHSCQKPWKMGRRSCEKGRCNPMNCMLIHFRCRQFCLLPTIWAKLLLYLYQLLAGRYELHLLHSRASCLQSLTAQFSSDIYCSGVLSFCDGNPTSHCPLVSPVIWSDEHVDFESTELRFPTMVSNGSRHFFGPSAMQMIVEFRPHSLICYDIPSNGAQMIFSVMSRHFWSLSS